VGEEETSKYEYAMLTYSTSDVQSVPIY